MSDKPEITESNIGDFVVVKDKSGNEFVCRLQDLRDPASLNEEEKQHCYDNVEDAEEKP